MHIKAALFSVFTGTLLLRHMVLAGGLLVASLIQTYCCSMFLRRAERTQTIATLGGDKLFAVISFLNVFALDHIVY